MVFMKRSEDCQEVVSFYHVNIGGGQIQLLSLESKHISPRLSSQPNIGYCYIVYGGPELLESNHPLALALGGSGMTGIYIVPSLSSSFIL